jgi:hypothetical protein
VSEEVYLPVTFKVRTPLFDTIFDQVVMPIKDQLRKVPKSYERSKT